MNSGAIQLSVVIPCLNAAEFLPFQLEALSMQDCDVEWEVVIADNGSTDATIEVAENFRNRFRLLSIISELKKGRQHACNAGAKAAIGEMLIFIDGDDEVASGFLKAMAAALKAHTFVASRLEHERLNPRNRGGYGAVQTESLSLSNGFLPFASGCSIGIQKAVFESIGGFGSDKYFCEDVDLSWKAQLAGHKIHFEPAAVIHYRQRESLSKMLRQHYNYGKAAALLFRDYAKYGMPKRKISEVVKEWALILWSLPRLRAHEEKARWLRRTGRCCGYIKGSFKHRVFYL